MVMHSELKQRLWPCPVIRPGFKQECAFLLFRSGIKMYPITFSHSHKFFLHSHPYLLRIQQCCMRTSYSLNFLRKKKKQQPVFIFYIWDQGLKFVIFPERIRIFQERYSWLSLYSIPDLLASITVLNIFLKFYIPLHE